MEKYSAYLDNINLLYVAFTRRRMICGICPGKACSSKQNSSTVKEAVQPVTVTIRSKCAMSGNFDVENQFFDLERFLRISKDTNQQLIRVTDTR